MRLAIIAPALALRAGLHALIRLPDSPENPDVVAEAASLDEFFAAGVEADMLLLAGEALNESALRRHLAGKEACLGLLALSDHPESVKLLFGLPLSGWGVLPLDVSAEELRAGLIAVTAGLAATTPELFSASMRASPSMLTGIDGIDPDQPDHYEALTDRESQVLQHLARGLANKQIALVLGISEHTVKFHVSAIYSKLGAANRTEAVRAGVRRGLVVL